ncbi:GTP-binding protein [Marinifilum sp. JC120]|nr:GTP-binding protein [Marinifilum sp. JC120]
MNLSSILPPGRNRNHLINMPEILVNCMLAACQHDEFKKMIGWKGIAVCPKGKKAWTMIISARPGVFGFCADKETQRESGCRALLALYYFPEKDEELLESMSLAANISAIQDDYIESVRHFSSDEKWAAPFRIAAVDAELDTDKNNFSLKFSADQYKISICRDGVATEDGQWIIAPGEMEEKIPAHAIATDFLLVLGAAISNSLEIPPCRFERIETPGKVLGYDAMGNKFPSNHKTTTLTDALDWREREALPSLAFSHSSTSTASGNAEDRDHLPAPLDKALFWETHDLAAIGNKGDHDYAFDDRPALIMISGFLGAGKTTFLNQLLEYHAARKELVAIIQNEIGQTGVDGKLLEGDDSIIELDEGCICCSLAGSLTKGIRQLKARFKPKVIVLEATGVANPFNVLNEIETIRSLVRLESVTTLVDAENGPQLFKESDIARNQVKAADTIILNKCDLVSRKEQEALTEHLRTLNSRALLVNTEFGEINPGTIYENDPRKQQSREDFFPPQERPGHTHDMEGFTSRRFAFNESLPRKKLQQLMDTLPENVFRLKGIVKIAENNDPLVVQYVCGRYEFSSLGGEFNDESFLVAIGRDMDLSELEKLEGVYS